MKHLYLIAIIAAMLNLQGCPVIAGGSYAIADAIKQTKGEKEVAAYNPETKRFEKVTVNE